VSRLLLVEDDDNLAESLTSYLSPEGFEVTRASTLAQGAEALDDSYDLVVLDWMLPDGVGIDLMRRWRGEGRTLPVVLLTARSDLVDRVLGLELGANDYVVKPFEPRELLARLRVQLRLRGQARSSASVKVGPIELCTDTRQARHDGQVVALTKQEYALLAVLVENPDRVFTRAELLDQAWGYENYPSTRTVDTHIVQLRQKFAPEWFETIRGVGYRLRSQPEG